MAARRRNKRSTFLPGQTYHQLICMVILTLVSYWLGYYKNDFFQSPQRGNMKEQESCEENDTGDHPGLNNVVLGLRGKSGTTTVRNNGNHVEDELALIERLVNERVKAAIVADESSGESDAVNVGAPRFEFPPSVRKFSSRGKLVLGSVVLVREDNTPRMKWVTGVVTKLYPGRARFSKVSGGLYQQRFPHACDPAAPRLGAGTCSSW